MNYLLMILSGLLGIFGVLIETHKEIKVRHHKVKVITKGGIITIIALFSILCLSIYKEYYDHKEAEKIAEENNFLKLSEIRIGPEYYFRIKFKDSLFQTDYWKTIAEMRHAQQEEKKWYNDLDSSYKNKTAQDASVKNYNSHFFDSLSRNSLFQNSNYLKKPEIELAKLTINAGVINGYINFSRDGMVTPSFYIDQKRAEIITGRNEASMYTPENSFYYEKNELCVKGKLSNSISAGTVYGSILSDSKLNANSSNIAIYFITKPTNSQIRKINKTLNRIEYINFRIDCDPSAFRWLIIPLEFTDDYTVTPQKCFSDTVGFLIKK